MRISDWSSDVCSSDLADAFALVTPEYNFGPTPALLRPELRLHRVELQAGGLRQLRRRFGRHPRRPVDQAGSLHPEAGAHPRAGHGADGSAAPEGRCVRGEGAASRKREGAAARVEALGRSPRAAAATSGLDRKSTRLN